MVKLFGKEIGKKDDDFPEIGRSGLGGIGVPGPAADPYSQALPPIGPAAPIATAPSSEHLQAISRNVDLVSSKLDTLKASLDALNQRLTSIEAQLKKQTPPQPQAQPQQDAFSSSFAQPQPQQQAYQQPQPQQQEDQGWHY